MWHIYDMDTDECLKIVDTYIEAEQWVMTHIREYICSIRRNIC